MNMRSGGTVIGWRGLPYVFSNREHNAASPRPAGVCAGYPDSDNTACFGPLTAGGLSNHGLLLSMLICQNAP
jgi:hypothetical protein